MEVLTGWLKRDGTFYPCGPAEHYKLINYLGYNNELEMEQAGICKLYRMPRLDLIGIYGLPEEIRYETEIHYDPQPGGHSLTEAQCHFMLSNNIMTEQEYNKEVGFI